MAGRNEKKGVGNPNKIRVRWSEYKGYLAIQNPVDRKVWIVQAKGMPSWIFDRIEKKDSVKLVDVIELPEQDGEESTESQE